jgi:tetratricopeptide (TPR) repeat protein
MPETTPEYRKTFEDNISLLLDELKLAIRWDRPSLLLTVHRSTPSQVKAQAELERRLGALKQTVVRVAASPESPNVAESILRAPERGRSVFFVSNLDRGGGADGKEAYRALNLFREHFVEHRMRAVFWLTVNEALTLPHLATDFWAFRHRVVEFSSPHIAARSSLPAGVLLWHIQAGPEAPHRLRDKLTSRERLLQEVPVRAESSSTRTELLYAIGYLHWALGDAAAASQALHSGLELAGQGKLVRMQSWLSNAAAIIDYEADKLDRAHAELARLAGARADDPVPAMNLGLTLSALGRNSDAVTQARRAAKLAPKNPALWTALGYIYVVMGRPEEADPCFRQAIELAPPGNPARAALAASLFVAGRAEEAAEQIRLACDSAGESLALCPVYAAAVEGRVERAVELLRAAVAEQRVSSADVRRDPVLHCILDSERLGSAV